MEKLEFVPVTAENLDDVAKTAESFKMPRSRRFINKALFNPAASAMTGDTIRGYMMRRGDGEYVGIRCYYYARMFFGRTPFLGGAGCLLGMRPEYGEWLFELTDKVKNGQDPALKLTCGNCVATKRSMKLSLLYGRAKKGPERCAVCSAGYPNALLRGFGDFLCRHRNEYSAGRFDLIWRFIAPLNAVASGVKRLFDERGGFRFRVRNSFDDAFFKPLWERFLAANTGVVSSREPDVLRWFFADSLNAGTIALITAEKRGRAEGYVLLRKYRQYKSNFIRYKIVDICAVGNDETCLRVLVKAALRYAAGHKGVKVQYIGGQPGLERWLDPVLPEMKPLEVNTCVWKTADERIRESLERGDGWFFGPYDGIRCLGHRGYIDV